MPLQTPTFTKTRGSTGGVDGVAITWSAAGDSDTFQAVSLPAMADKSIQVEGTFGSATIHLGGSNDGVNFEDLNDAFGTVIAIAAAGIKQVTESTLQVKPRTSGGTGSSLVVTVFCRRVLR
jgi:hypothetical protein